ncbi:DUF1499 domain-containing protein [Paenibacillus thermotolerans]|uniref:DUF1499 domain-containing protein n=1 Tax=Paenibacillus thermotolerans TaxID=3027807 RepID=UPI002367BC54|nr:MULTISPECIES: DUF1499 domain-containing protein [unclassified Paenibacillus]
MLKRTLIGLVRSHESTGEKATQPELRTKYYKLPKDQLWDEVIQIFKKKPGYKLLHEVKSVGEIVMEKRTMTGRVQDVTVTVFSINPLKSAIDVYSASRGSLGDLGSNYRTILDIFNTLDKKLAQHKITN